jgi:hypothetical protein
LSAPARFVILSLNSSVALSKEGRYENFLGSSLRKISFGLVSETFKISGREK